MWISRSSTVYCIKDKDKLFLYSTSVNAFIVVNAVDLELFTILRIYYHQKKSVAETNPV